jgi:Holliday junction resolvase RusA-like endonuclease
MLTCRVPMTPHTLLRPNVTSIGKRERAKLPYPLNCQPAPKAKALLKRELRETAGWAARDVAPRQPITGPVLLHIVIVWEKGRRRQDFDAAVYGMKGVQDALMDAGWIVDDAQVVGMTIKQITGTPDGGYVIVSMELAESEEAA